MNIEKVKEKIKGAITNIRKLDKDYIVIGIIIIAVIIFIVLNIGKVTEFNKEEKENTTINASIEESKNDIEEKEKIISEKIMNFDNIKINSLLVKDLKKNNLNILKVRNIEIKEG